MVLAVNILSFKKTYVIIAKTKLETPKPTSFEVHSSPVSATTFLIAYQKHIPMGIAKNTFVNIGLFSKDFQTNCELNWNQAITLPIKKNSTPIYKPLLNVNSTNKKAC